MQTIRETFGTRMRLAMKAKGITQEKLAKKLYCEQQAISHYVCGRRSPRIEMIVQIAEILDVSVDYLLGRD